MRILIAPNAFKGSLTAGEAAQRIAKGLKKSRLSCTLQLIPIADGGDGTAHLISKKLSATFNNKLLGPNGAAAVFGPQKGADKKEAAMLERGLGQLNKIVKKDVGIDMDSILYGGSAGGVGAGMAAFTNAVLENGISYYLDLTGFENDLKNTDILITAEGKLDAQTLEGKGPYGVAKLALQHKVPVILLAGQVPKTAGKDLQRYFNVILPIGSAPVPLKEAIKNTAADLERTSMEIGNLLAQKKEK